MLFISVATLAGVVTVSDPGQAQGKLITTEDIVPFLKVSLTASNTPDLTVFLTVMQSGAASDIDLFSEGMTNKLTGMQMVLGPFVIKSGQTNNIVISARVNSVKAMTNSPPTVSLNLTSVSNSTPSLVEGTLPIQGTPYIVDTNSLAVIQGKVTQILLYPGKVYVFGKGEPFRKYYVQASTNLIDWNTITATHPADSDGGLQWVKFMELPKQCFFFRLGSD